MSSISKFDNNNIKGEEILPNDKDKEILKLIDNFFLKSCLLICSKELSSSDTLREYLHLTESWFEIMENYQTYDLPHCINTWLHFDGKSTLPPLVIETYLDLRNLPESFLVRLMDKDGNLWSVCKGTKKTEIVLERWLIELDNTTAKGRDVALDSNDYNSLNNQISLLLRYLHTLIQLLPINSLISSINKQYLSIGTRIIDGSKPILSKGRIGLSKPIISSYSNQINETNIPKRLEQKKITPVWTKFGLLRVSVSYRRECKFELQNLHQPEEEDGIKPQKIKPITSISPTSHTFGIVGPRKSTSISPSARASFGVSGTSLDQQQQQPSPLTKKSGGITRQVQPFKVGSVNSLAYEKSTSQIPSRNPSVSSVFVNTSARRSSIGSNFATNNINNNNIVMANNSNSTMASNVVPKPDTGSVDSNSKYLSSFGNIRRHSSINRNIENINSIDRALRSGSDVLINTNRRSSGNSIQQSLMNNNLPHDTSNDDLLDFVKMIDSKPEIKLKPKQSELAHKDDNISHSLLRYQNLKSSNNLLSEDLSLSYTLYHNQDENKNSLDAKGHFEDRRHSTSSNSKSPLYSVSPYSHNNIKEYNPQYHAFSTSALNSRKNSLEKSRQSLLPPIYGGESMSYHDDHERTEEPHHLYTSRDNILLQDQEYKRGRSQSNDTYGNSHHIWRNSKSPRSFPSSDPFSHSSNKDKLTYHQNYHLSQPTLMSVPAHAKLHRPSIQSTEILEDEGRRMSRGKSSGSPSTESKKKDKVNYSQSNTNQGIDVDDEVDDDDLMFFMSDMNMRSDC
ncbi:autophagy protein 13 [Monosporozyma unispora]|nr:autophagy protein 13 [Kazachstania unispora]